MKERPILFSAPIVRAILEGRKTQTRRAIKPQPVGEIDNLGDGESIIDIMSDRVIRCPYGQPGDRLWVRETWGRFDERIVHHRENVIYRASGDVSYQRWRPSIHMPRWASRITLEIESVRVERLNDITEEDAQAEGVTPDSFEGMEHPDNQTLSISAHRSAFVGLWESINGPGSWDINPWVWVIQFKRIEKGTK